MTTRAREKEREGGGAWEQIGGPVDPTDRGMRIRTSSKGGPRRRRISIFRGDEKEKRVEEERGVGL